MNDFTMKLLSTVCFVENTVRFHYFHIKNTMRKEHRIAEHLCVI